MGSRQIDGYPGRARKVPRSPVITSAFVVVADVCGALELRQVGRGLLDRQIAGLLFCGQFRRGVGGHAHPGPAQAAGLGSHPVVEQQVEVGVCRHLNHGVVVLDRDDTSFATSEHLRFRQ